MLLACCPPTAVPCPRPPGPSPLLTPPRLLAGTAFATGGEDGTVKVWSRNGMLRSTLAQLDSPVYSVAWSGDCDQVLHCSGSQLAIKSMQSSAKQAAWKAHDGVVLKADWSPISGLIVSGGEDCRWVPQRAALHAAGDPPSSPHNSQP